MELAFIYSPVDDLESAIGFYRDQLGLEEAWREGDSTVSFALPGTSTQIMVSVDSAPPGPMFLVDDAAAWVEAHPGVEVITPVEQIPGGALAVLAGPGENVFYVMDQTDGPPEE